MFPFPCAGLLYLVLGPWPYFHMAQVLAVAPRFHLALRGDGCIFLSVEMLQGVLVSIPCMVV